MARLPKGIVIASYEPSKPFLNDLMASIKTDYPIYICWEGIGRPHNSHEYGAVEKGMELFDEFIFLHATCEIKDNSIFDKLFSIKGHVALTDGFYHLIGKYVSDDMPIVPEVHNKAESVANELTWFTKPYTIYEEQLPHTTNNFIEKHGRKNMVCENSYIKKYKGTWGTDMIKESGTPYGYDKEN